MINDSIKTEILKLWATYSKSDKTVLNTKGHVIEDIDDLRRSAIVEIKNIINSGFSISGFFY